MFFGVACYPERWPEECWPVDAKMMQKTGIKGVRMGKFAWSKIEPVGTSIEDVLYQFKPSRQM